MTSNEQTNVSPPLPWKIRLATSAISAFFDVSFRADGSINRSLNFLDFKSPANPKPVLGVKSFDITVDSPRKLWFRLFVPATAEVKAEAETEADVNLPVIVFFHGGGFVFLAASSKVYDLACRKFAKKVNAVVVSVTYRLAPEHKFPSQYDDGFDVLKFLDTNGSAVLPKNADLSKCYLAGDSAGANIAHHLAVRYASLSQETMFQNIRIEGLIMIQPFFGGEERTESELRFEGGSTVSMKRTDMMWKAFLPVGLIRDHQTVNVSGPNAVDLSGLEKYPKTLVIIGGSDPLQDWQRRYYEYLRKSGKDVQLKEVPNAIHGFYIFSELPESANLYEHASKFINAV